MSYIELQKLHRMDKRFSEKITKEWEERHRLWNSVYKSATCNVEEKSSLSVLVTMIYHSIHTSDTDTYQNSISKIFRENF